MELPNDDRSGETRNGYALTSTSKVHPTAGELRENYESSASKLRNPTKLKEKYMFAPDVVWGAGAIM